MKWLFAKLLPAASRKHESYVAARKRELFAPLASGSVVVELGPGSGPNFRYFPKSIRWIGIEPNPHLDAPLRQAAAGFNAEILRLDGARLPLADHAADAVVCTLVLCSVADAAAVVREALRVLRPGGRFFFLEHVGAAHGTGLRTGQRLADPLWSLVADGCRTSRDTAQVLRAAGFSNLQIDEFQVPQLGLLRPHIAGVGIK